MSTAEMSIRSQLPRWAESLIQQGVDTQGVHPGEVNWRARQAAYRVFCSAARRGIDHETVIVYMRSKGHQAQLWDQLCTRHRKEGQRTYQVALRSLLKTLRQIWGRACDLLRSKIDDLNCDGSQVLDWARDWRQYLASGRSVPGLTPLQSRALKCVSVSHLSRGYSTVTVPCSEVAEYCGVSKRTAWKTLRHLVEDGVLVKLSAGSPVLRDHKAAIFQVCDPSAYIGEANRSPSVQVKSTKGEQSPPSTPSSSSPKPMRGVLGVPTASATPRKGRRPSKKDDRLPFDLRVRLAMGYKLPTEDEEWGINA